MLCGAFVTALDLKETDVLLNLLKEVTPSVVIEKCKKSLYFVLRSSWQLI